MADPAPSVLCGSLSLHPVSTGAVMHRTAYAALGLDWSYVPFAVENLEGALAGMRALGIRGFGVSMPFKIAIQPLLDRLDPHAQDIGAVNTVVNDSGVLTGYNTDAIGAVRALKESQPDLAGARCLLVGAGGAARAVAYGLARENAAVHIVNRTESRARQLAEAVQQRVGVRVGSGGLDQLRQLGPFDCVVNASSTGMEGYEATPIPTDSLHSGLIVMDIVYKPVETALIRAARSRGCRTVHGGRMLLHQAARQFELYTGQAAPLPVMEAALQEKLV